MMGFVQNWLTPRGNPIGVDFGADCLRLAQVTQSGSEYRLLAAASADVPSHVRHNPAARLQFFMEATRDLLAQGGFRGRQAVLCLPVGAMHIQHLRMGRMDEEAMKKALPWEARGKLPIDPSQAILRHIVAGDVYSDAEPRSEVILMAAGRELVEQLLAAAAKAKLDVIGMNVQPKALIDCFCHIYRRKGDQTATTCYVDIGSSGARAVIAEGSQILFARSVPVGGEHFNRAAASALAMSVEDAKVLRIQLAHLQPPPARDPDPRTIQPEPQAIEEAMPLLGARLSAERRSTVAPIVAPTAPVEPPSDAADPSASDDDALNPAKAQDQYRLVEQACREPLTKLVEELDLCRRYYESTFPNKPVQRLIFVGGEARQRSLCQHIARELGLAAQIGDPLVRMSRSSDVGIESGIDRRQPQPGWAVAIGLSMGPGGVAATESAAA